MGLPKSNRVNDWYSSATGGGAPTGMRKSDQVDSFSSSAALDKTIRKIIHEDEAQGLNSLCRGDPLTSSGKRAQMGKMLTLTLIPIIGLSIMSIMQLLDVSQKNTNALIVRNSISFSTEIGTLVHYLQRERDMTALHVSSRNQGSETRILLTTSYPLTDEALSSASLWTGDKLLRAQYATKSDFGVFLKDHRSQLIAGDTSVKAEIEFYTEAIRVLIDWLYETIQISSEGGDWKMLVAYQLLIVSKEDMGVERTLGGVYYTQGGFRSYDDYLWYLEKYFVGIGNFEASKLFSPAAESYFFEQMDSQEQNISHNVEQMRAEILLFDNSKRISPSWERSTWWFDNMTTYLDVLFDVQMRLAENVINSLDYALTRDTGSISSSIGLLILITIICPLIVTFVRAIVNDIQSYALSLAEQTRQLDRERRRTDSLLFQMLPKLVAEQLKRNEHVQAENFDEVTVFFSDIVGFTRISSSCTPMQVVAMLNNLYLCFDTRIDMYDVYKIETIGDAYMVASAKLRPSLSKLHRHIARVGIDRSLQLPDCQFTETYTSVPKRNGRRHVSEICTMGLDLMHHISHLDVPHLPGTKMRLRAGVHSGPTVAGVVGTRMPRYCLFGDTVNTASRMETYGEPDKIHISAQTNAALEVIGGYVSEPRGNVTIKGKGTIATYWLLEKTGFEESLHCMPGCKAFNATIMPDRQNLVRSYSSLKYGSSQESVNENAQAGDG